MTATATTTRTWRDWLGLACRLLAAGVFLVSGIAKARSFAGSANAVKGFQLFPDAVAELVGYALPVVEIIVGLLLLVGLFTRLSAVVYALMMLAFVAGIAQAWARGLKIDCGCFGGGGVNEAVTWRTYLWEVVRDLAALVPALYLLFRPRTPFAADNWLNRDLDTYDTDED